MVSLKEIQKFIQELAKTDIVKVELKSDDLELKVRFKPDVEVVEKAQEQVILPQPQVVMPPQPSVTNPTVPTQITEQPVQEENKQEELVAIKAPMVGTFYRRPAPDKPPYVEVGDYVKPNDIVCIIEAMKLFNEIEAEVEGTIEKILVEDATPVEYDQPLFLVRPAKK